MIQLHHANRQRDYKLSDIGPLVREAADHALYASPFIRELLAEGIGIDLDWTLVGPRTMRGINREQREVDRETDILSFPAREMKEGHPLSPLEPWEFLSGEEEGDRLFLGDLILAPAVIEKQAEEYGHSFEEEIRFLVIHGVLHLLGYDHETEEDEEVMNALQKNLMAAYRDLPRGFVALAGRPNVGKSTLLNELSDRTLAITSAKPQTTRHAIRSVLTTEDYQIAFLDTPGLHQPKNALGKAMMKAATSAIGQADVLVVMIDASWNAFVGQLEERIIRQAKEEKKPVILVINKSDAAPKEKILPLIKVYDDAFKLDAYVPISALDGDGIDRLLEEIVRLLPVGRPLFDASDETDQTERMMASELIRREVLLQTGNEIPYGVTVLIERFEEEESDRGREIEIDALIITEREGHKQILIGKGGGKVKSIGMAAREAMTQLFDARCHLSLFVKVKPNWQNRMQDLYEAGYAQKD